MSKILIALLCSTAFITTCRGMSILEFIRIGKNEHPKFRIKNSRACFEPIQSEYSSQEEDSESSSLYGPESDLFVEKNLFQGLIGETHDGDVIPRALYMSSYSCYCMWNFYIANDTQKTWEIDMSHLHNVTISNDGSFEESNHRHYSHRSQKSAVKYKLSGGHAEQFGIFSRFSGGKTEQNLGYIIIRKKRKELGRLNFYPPKNYKIGEHYIEHVWINRDSSNTFSDTKTGYVLYKMNRHRKTDIIKIKKVDKKYRYTNRKTNLESLSKKKQDLPLYEEPIMTTDQLRATYSNPKVDDTKEFKGD